MANVDYVQPHPLRNDALFTPNFKDNNSEPGVYNVQITFVNGTHREISITDRLNNIVVIPADAHSRLVESHDKLAVNMIYTFKNERTAEDTLRRMRQARDSGAYFSVANAEFVQALETMLDRTNHWGVLVMRIRHEIHVNQFDKIGAIYHENTDLVVMFANTSAVCLHPHSAEAHSRQVFKDTGISKSGTVQMVEVIDNERIADRRYMYAMKQVVPVISTQSDTRESGVYVSRRTPSMSGTVNETVQQLTFVEAEKEIGLYLTMEDARTNGDPQRELALRKTEAETALERERAQFKQQQQVWENDKAVRDREMEVLKHDLEQSRLIIKQRTEERNEVLSAKKENMTHTSDVLRTVATAVGAIVTLVAAGVGLVRWLNSTASLARAGASVAGTFLGWVGLGWLI